MSNGEMKYLSESVREDARKEERVNETAGNIQWENERGRKKKRYINWEKKGEQGG